jgi:hypothetical protein
MWSALGRGDQRYALGFFYYNRSRMTIAAEGKRVVCTTNVDVETRRNFDS